jgi:hypothetical protein
MKSMAVGGDIPEMVASPKSDPETRKEENSYVGLNLAGSI